MDQIYNNSHFIFRMYVSFILYFKRIKFKMNHILFIEGMYLSFYIQKIKLVMNHILFIERMYLSFFILQNQIDNESHFIYRKYISLILYFKESNL